MDWPRIRTPEKMWMPLLTLCWSHYTTRRHLPYRSADDTHTLSLSVCVCVRMEISGVYFLSSISILSVLVKAFTTVSAAKVGLAMVYTLQLTGE